MQIWTSKQWEQMLLQQVATRGSVATLPSALQPRQEAAASFQDGGDHRWQQRSTGDEEKVPRDPRSCVFGA